jgi:hypothetical protein
MRLTKSTLCFFLLLSSMSEKSHAQDRAGRGMGSNVEPLVVQQTNDTIPYDAQNSTTLPLDPDDPRFIPGQQDPNQIPGQPGQAQGQQDSRFNQGQQDPNQIPGQQDPNQIPGQQGQQNPGFLPGQGQQDPNQNTGQQNPRPAQGQDLNTRPSQGQPGQENQRRMQGQQDPMQGQGQGQSQQPPTQPQAGQGQTQDQLPPGTPQGRPLPKKPKVLPRPTSSPTPTPTFTPAPVPEEPPVRPQPSGPKTTEQRAYESAMQARWKKAADEIISLKSRGEAFQGNKGKAFRESLRTASGNRSMARTKLTQLVRGSSADFDKLKTGVERAFTDLDTSIAKVRSYFDEPPPP